MPSNKKKRPAKKAGRRAAPKAAETPSSAAGIPLQLQAFLSNTAIPKGFVNLKKLTLLDLRKRLVELNVQPTVPLEQLLTALSRI